MSTVVYLEPRHIQHGRDIYEKYNGTGSIVGILSDAQRCVRQRGPAGLRQWIESDDKRNFLLDALENKCGIEIDMNEADSQTAWTQTEQIIRILGAAKYYAKCLRQKGSS